MSARFLLKIAAPEFRKIDSFASICQYVFGVYFVAGGALTASQATVVEKADTQTADVKLVAKVDVPSDLLLNTYLEKKTASLCRLLYS